jgi:hypothetical protein
VLDRLKLLPEIRRLAQLMGDPSKDDVFTSKVRHEAKQLGVGGCSQELSLKELREMRIRILAEHPELIRPDHALPPDGLVEAGSSWAAVPYRNHNRDHCGIGGPKASTQSSLRLQSVVARFGATDSMERSSGSWLSTIGPMPNG